MYVDLVKFRIKDGKSERVDDWFKYINETRDDVILTFAGEHVHIESMFRVKEEEHEYLYWYTMQEDAPDECENLRIDQTHLDFWEECIDKKYRHKTYQADVSLYSYAIGNALKRR